MQDLSTEKAGKGEQLGEQRGSNWKAGSLNYRAWNVLQRQVSVKSLARGWKLGKRVPRASTEQERGVRRRDGGLSS